MEPGFQRGDILFLTNSYSRYFENFNTGDIVVYRIPGVDIPIVHRVLEARSAPLERYIPFTMQRNSYFIDDRLDGGA